MLKNNRYHWALALSAAMTAAIGCGGNGETKGSGGTGGQTSSSSVSTSDSSSSATTGTGGTGGDAGATCQPDQFTVFAVNQLYFGEGNSGEWKKFGFNIDGKVSNALDTDLCQPNDGGSPIMAYPDGDNGIDNPFGKNLLPTILALYPTWTNDANNGIDTGVFTALMKMECLTKDTGDLPLFTTKLTGATTLGSIPKWDGTDKWPVEPGLLSDPKDPESTTILFDKSSLKGDAFDTGKDVTFILSVPVKTQSDSTSIKLTLHAARMTMTMSKDRKTATGGMIGGVLNTEEFVTEVKKVGALLGVCGTALFDSLVQQVRQASDIMTDGTQDPAKTCDGISMGIGFDLTEAQIGDVGPANPTGNICP
jgi:hypothetical protein